MSRYYLSTMQDKYRDKMTGERKLILGRWTSLVEFDTFYDLCSFITLNLLNKQAQTKFALNGFIPSKFDEGEHPDKPERGIGKWRLGSLEQDEVCVLLGDVDNNLAHLPNVEWADVISNIRATLGYAPSGIGYTTWSHQPQTPRWRFTFDISRPMSRLEGKKVTLWLNAMCCGSQLDPRMADVAHYSIAPHDNATLWASGGSALDVDDILARLENDVKTNTFLAKGLAKITNVFVGQPFTGTIDPNAVSGSSDPCKWIAPEDYADFGSCSTHYTEIIRILARIWHLSLIHI